MDVIGSDAIIQQCHLKLRECFPHFGPVGFPIAGELQQEGTIVTAIGHMKNASFNPQTVSASHAAEFIGNDSILTAKKRRPKIALTLLAALDLC